MERRYDAPQSALTPARIDAEAGVRNLRTCVFLSERVLYVALVRYLGLAHVRVY